MPRRTRDQKARDQYISDQLTKSRVPPDWSGGGDSWSRADGVEVRIGPSFDAGHKPWMGRRAEGDEWSYLGGGDAESAIRMAEARWPRES